MKIKYTDLYEEIGIQLHHLDFFATFKRNKWKDVPEQVARELLRSSQWISEVDSHCDLGIIGKSKRIALKRSSALGDLIMLVPIMRELRRRFTCHVTLLTLPCYIYDMEKIGCFHDVKSIVGYQKSDYDKVIHLDGVLECDHDLECEDRLVHRTILYEKFIGIKCSEYDFSIQPEEKDFDYVENLLNDHDQRFELSADHR